MNTRDCEHGQLRRVCPLCEKDAEIARLTEQLRLAEIPALLNHARGNTLRDIAATLTGDADANPQIGADRAVAEIASLRALLHEVVSVLPACPICAAQCADGLVCAPDCRLAAALREDA